MLTNKQQIFFNLLVNCYQELHEFPSIGFIKKRSSYKSYNTIYKYLSILEQKGYIIYNQETKKITYIKTNIIKDAYSLIPYFDETKYFYLDISKLNPHKKYFVVPVTNNDLKSLNILKNDLAIIEKTTNYLQNKVVFIKKKNINYFYKVQKKEELYQLSNDKEIFFQTNLNSIIGKVVLIIHSMD